MSESLSTLEPSERPCTHCGTGLYDEVRFCFECGAPVVPELDLPCAPAGALEELRTAAFSAVSIRPIEDDDDDELEPGKPIEIESLAFDAVVDEVPIEIEDDEDGTGEDDGTLAETKNADVLPHSGAEHVADSSGTVVALAPERPFPFWPAPPRGETVLSPPPTAPSTVG